jgi:hypothetical protein
MAPPNQAFVAALARLVEIAHFHGQVGISAMGVLRPDLMMKCIVPGG